MNKQAAADFTFQAALARARAAEAECIRQHLLGNVPKTLDPREAIDRETERNRRKALGM